MKKITAYIAFLCFGIILSSDALWAQSSSEIKFNLMNPSSTTNKNLVTISTAINAKQSVSSNGIHFTLILQNNSGRDIAIKNIADQLTVVLSNERGLDVSVPNNALLEINRGPEDRKWRFRSESVSQDGAFINGKEDKRDFKKLEYIEIPTGGIYKANLIIKNMKQVATPQDVVDKFRKPTVNLAPGKYKLRMYLLINLHDQDKLRGKIAPYFQSPMIDIEYGN